MQLCMTFWSPPNNLADLSLSLFHNRNIYIYCKDVQRTHRSCNTMDIQSGNTIIEITAEAKKIQLQI